MVETPSRPPGDDEEPDGLDADERAEGVGEREDDEELDDLAADDADEEITERVRGGRSRAISIPY